MARKVSPADKRGNDMYEAILGKTNFGHTGGPLKSILSHVAAFSDAVLATTTTSAYARTHAEECKLQAEWVRTHTTAQDIFELGMMFRELELSVSGDQAMIDAYSSSQTDPGAGPRKRHAEARERDAEILARAEKMYRSAKTDEKRTTKYIAGQLYKEYGEDREDDGGANDVEESKRLYGFITMRALSALVSKLRKRLIAEQKPGKG